MEQISTTELDREALIKLRHSILDSWTGYESQLLHIYNAITQPGTMLHPFCVSLFSTLQNPDLKLSIVDSGVSAFIGMDARRQVIAPSWKMLLTASHKFRILRNKLAHSTVGVQNADGKSYARISSSFWLKSGKIKIPYGYSAKDLEPMKIKFAYLGVHAFIFQHLVSTHIEGKLSGQELNQVFHELDIHLTERWNQIFQYPPAAHIAPPQSSPG
tara:strand:- start:121 stop:765 length:645 start_codon:yes stop_codon:yes gene_type:complete